MAPAVHAPDLLRNVGLSSDGMVVLGQRTPQIGAGVYIVELASPAATAPIELTVVGKWVERVPGMRLDGSVPTSRAVRARLASLWIPSATIVYVGSSERSVSGRIAALVAHQLGDPRPHAAGQWLKALNVRDMRVWWATTDAPNEYEDALLDAFASTVGPEERAALHDQAVVLPFANLRRATGERKDTGLSGASLPLEREPAPPPTRVVDVPEGDAEGARPEPRGSGTTRRTNAARPRPATPRRSRAADRPTAPVTTTPQPVEVDRSLTTDGFARLQAELADLSGPRRREVIDRVRTAREHGDLKENAEYHAAREEQSFLEGRIQALEARLRNVTVTDAPADTSRVGLGSTVTIEVDGEESTFTIVGSADSDPKAGRISGASPVGRALVGRQVGDVAVVRTPGGEVSYRVVAID